METDLHQCTMHAKCIVCNNEGMPLILAASEARWPTPAGRSHRRVGTYRADCGDPAARRAAARRRGRAGPAHPGRARAALRSRPGRSRARDRHAVRARPRGHRPGPRIPPGHGGGPGVGADGRVRCRASLVSSPDPGRPQRVTHRYREGALRIPAELDGIVVAVLGLDNRPQARPAGRCADRPPRPGLLHPAPGGRDLPVPGRHRRHRPDHRDHRARRRLLRHRPGHLLLRPRHRRRRRSRRSASTAPATCPDQDPHGADGEVLLDIEVAGSVAPGAAQVVYFAPNTDQGFVDAVTNAVHAAPTPVAVSISWGGPEDSWTAQAMTALDAAIADGVALGVTVYRGGRRQRQQRRGHRRPAARRLPRVQPARAGLRRHQPAGRPGDRRDQRRRPSGTTASAVARPVAASATTFGLPTWQASAGVPGHAGRQPGRGVPDVAGNADPATGYQVLVDGQQR